MCHIPLEIPNRVPQARLDPLLFFGIWPGDKAEINKEVTDYLDLHFTELLSVQYVLSYHALPPTSSASSRPALGLRWKT